MNATTDPPPAEAGEGTPPGGQPDERSELFERLRSLFEEDELHLPQLKQELEGARPEDLADFLSELEPEEEVLLFRALEGEDQDVVIEEADPISRAEVLSRLGHDELLELIGLMAPDDAADVLEHFPEAQRAEVLAELRGADPEHARDLVDLLQFAPDSAGGMMTTEFLSVPEDATAGEAIARIQGSPDAETVNLLYATDPAGRLTGVVSIREVLTRGKDTPISEFMTSPVIHAHVDTDQEEVAARVARYNLHALPVVDEDHVLQGVVTVDDVIDAIQEEFDEDLFLLAGTSPELIHESSYAKARKRLPWLLVTLVLGLLNALVISGWEATLRTKIALVFFLPALAAMAGNAGIQSTTLMVRSLATDSLGGERVLRTILDTLGVGVIVGASCGLVGSLVATGFEGMRGAGFDWSFGVVIFLGMASSMLVATVFGAVIPLLCQRLGADPAVASGPFTTTLNDMIALLIFLAIASVQYGGGS